MPYKEQFACTLFGQRKRGQWIYLSAKYINILFSRNTRSKPLAQDNSSLPRNRLDGLKIILLGPAYGQFRRRMEAISSTTFREQTFNLSHMMFVVWGYIFCSDISMRGPTLICIEFKWTVLYEASTRRNNTQFGHYGSSLAWTRGFQ